MAVPAHDERDFEFAEKYQSARTDCGSADERRASARGSDERRVHGTWALGGFGAVHGADVRASDRENDRGRCGEGIWQGRDDVPAEGLGHFAAAILGHADSGDLLREGRDRAGAGRSVAGTAAGRGDVDGAGAIAAGGLAGICEYHLPEMRRAGAARDGHDGHVRRFVVVFLSLHRSAQ